MLRYSGDMFAMKSFYQICSSQSIQAIDCPCSGVQDAGIAVLAWSSTSVFVGQCFFFALRCTVFLIQYAEGLCFYCFC